MKKSITSILICSLIFIPAPNAGAASPKVGSICSKLNAKSSTSNLKLKCVKVGKKLVWSAVGTATAPLPMTSPTPMPTQEPVVVQTPTPSLTPSKSALSTPSPTASKKTFVTPLLPNVTNPLTWENIESRFAEISSIAWQSTQETIKANSSNGVSIPIKIIYAPNTPTSHYPGFENYVKTGIQLWSRFTLPRNTTFLVFSYDEIPWAESTITKILTDSGSSEQQAQAAGKNLAHAPYGGPDCGGANSGMISDSQGIGVFALCPRNEGTDPYYAGPLQIHEFTHQMQGSGYVGTKYNQQAIMPCWISEGLAHTAGLSAGTNSLSDYLRVRMMQASHPVTNVAGGHSSNQVDRSTITYDFLTNFYAESTPPGCFQLPSYSLGYSVGFLTTEALSAIGGIESTMLLYARTANGETFNEAFKNVYGVTWAYASDVLARVVSKEMTAF